MSPSEKPPAANMADANEFLANLPSSDREHLVLIREGRGPIVKTFAASERQKALAWVEQHQGTGNVYYHANPLKDDIRNRKARKEDVAAGRMAHVDVDDLNALEKIKALPLPPSVVVMSGGGFQVLYYLRKLSTDLAALESINKKLAERLGGDHCWSADHLLRLPGPPNMPGAIKRARGRTPVLAKIVKKLTKYARRYDLEDLEAMLGIRPGTALDVNTNMSATALAGEITDAVRALIRHGDDLDHPIGSADAKYKSRSEALFAVACGLAQAGRGVDEIVAVLLDQANGISASVLEKPHPAAYARRQAERGMAVAQSKFPDMSKKGPLRTLANAMVALIRLELTFAHDLFSHRKLVNGHVLQAYAGELTDDVCAVLRLEALRRWNVDFGKEYIRDAALSLCMAHPFHPIKDYLADQVWDGVPRVQTWLIDYLGVEDTPLHRAIAELVLMAAVRRVRQPGVKFDFILVLEGAQGSGKSSAVAILAGKGHFSDQELLTLDPKTQMEALEGIWIFEIGELQGLTRTETNKVKAFASRESDRARMAYARFREDRPRQNIFIGTTNDEQYLIDTTGNRRFWPVKTGRIDLDALRRDRDQLWAEAAQIEAEGRPLSLPEALWEDAGAAQEARLMDDPWLDALVDVCGEVENGIERISTHDVLCKLEIPAERQNQFTAKRLRPLMRKHGWDGPKGLRFGGRVVRGYQRPAPGRPDTRKASY